MPYFFFNDTATTEIYTLSLHDALPIYTVERYVKLGLDEGAKLLCGGSKPTDLPARLDPNAYYLPTIFEADNSMKIRSEEPTSELQSPQYLVCRLLLEKNKTKIERP